MQILRMVGALLVILICPPSIASESVEQKLAAELLTLTNDEKTLADVRLQMGKMMTAQLGSLEVPDGMRDRVATFQQEILDLVFEELAFEKMKPSYVEAYATTFTADELSGLLEFYESPAGRAFADKLPVLMTRMMEVAQARMQALAPRITRMNEEFVADLKKAATQEPGE